MACYKYFSYQILLKYNNDINLLFVSKPRLSNYGAYYSII